MGVILFDANAVIMHGQRFPRRVSDYQADDELALPASVKQELVDDVLGRANSPRNHRESARDLRRLIADGYLVVRSPDFDRFGDVIDEARRRIADENLPEHAVKADQYIPALVCACADEGVVLVTADRKLRRVTIDIAARRNLDEAVSVRDPLTVL